MQQLQRASPYFTKSETPPQEWGGEFWGKGFFLNTVGQHGSKKLIAAYVKNQGTDSDYRRIHKAQLDLGL
ncbi:hypothetical protein DB346_13655 [Verrucomicrobia bacterium LW23]|nr:hypothetical protein DB346_13655 [Verrucomicrobia bacterium LW23]